MKSKLFWLFLGICGLFSFSQTAEAQKVALKTNFAHWAVLGSPNAGVEFALGQKVTLDVDAGFNLWKYKEPLELRHWIAQPELRYWFCESFNGTFVGLHGHYGQYNVGGINLPIGRLKELKDNRYEGDFYGAGLSLGHQFVLSPLLNLELSLGGGWARTDYRKYECMTCGSQLGDGVYDYFGLTRATLSLVLFLK